MRASADDALFFLGPEPKFTGNNAAYERAQYKKWMEDHKPTDADRELAQKALDYARESLGERTDLNDFLHNLMVASKQSSINGKLSGIMAALVPHYIREVERQTLKENEAKSTANSKHVGTVGNREIHEVTVLSVRTVETQFGNTQIHKLLTNDGNVMVWFCSADGLATGAKVLIKATIKRHDQYNGTKQTIVNRVVVLTPEELEKENKKAAKKAAKIKQNPAIV